jgi:hypothetical protein
MEIRTTLPEADIEQILAVVRAQTDAPIRSLVDGELGPEVMTGNLYGFTWLVRRAPSGWKVLFKREWVS